MNDESRARLGIARRIVAALAASEPPVASLLAGSVAQGIADEHSDIDLLNYYAALPDPARFDAVLREIGAARSGTIAAPGPEGFSASYTIDGVQLQTGAETVASVEDRLDRIGSGDVDWITAKVAMGLIEGLPVHGEARIESWKRRASYPEALRHREVESNLRIFPIWALDDHLAARDAELFRRQMLLDGAFRVVAILSALNRLYFTTFQFKRMRAHIDRMRVKPEKLGDRLERVAGAPPSEAALVLRDLVEETRAIIVSEMPAVDVNVRWQPMP